jgi:hypothetical protein
MLSLYFFGLLFVCVRCQTTVAPAWNEWENCSAAADTVECLVKQQEKLIEKIMELEEMNLILFLSERQQLPGPPGATGATG